MRYLEVAGWKKNSCDDGPGIRSVLFLQGCSMNCPGCHNRDIQKRGEGSLMSIDEIISFVESRCHNKRITISGGEPLEQWEALEKLLISLKEKGFDICLYRAGISGRYQKRFSSLSIILKPEILLWKKEMWIYTMSALKIKKCIILRVTGYVNFWILGLVHKLFIDSSYSSNTK